MKTAKEMYQYCENNKLGTGMGQKWGTKHFTLIEKALMADELRKFKGLLDDGVITEDEYANKKQQLLEYGA